MVHFTYIPAKNTHENFLKKNLRFLLLLVSVYVRLCTMCEPDSHRSRKGIRSPGTGVINGCEPHVGAGDLT